MTSLHILSPVSQAEKKFLENLNYELGLISGKKINVNTFRKETRDVRISIKRYNFLKIAKFLTSIN